MLILVQVLLTFLYILTEPALFPPLSLLGDPIATTVPSSLIDNENPETSVAPSPSISAPIFVQTLLIFLYTLTLPTEFIPPPSFIVAPIATVVPSLLNATVVPKRSPAASLLISEPI